VGVAGFRASLRAQVVVLVVAALVAGMGAAIWSRTIADDGDATELIRLGAADAADEYVDPALVNPDRTGEPLPDVRVATADGERIRLQPDGLPMVVNVWTSTCGPCSRELTYFARVADDHAGQVRFVGVDPLDDAERMVDFAAERGVTYELLRDDEYELFDALGLVSFPATLFVAADGTVVAQTGEVSETELRDHIDALLDA
jgi:thiol-disulfide isomerase/thioredoxin